MTENRIKMLPYVLLGTAIKAVIGICYLTISHQLPDFDLPRVGTVSLFLAAGAAVYWYIRRNGVRMRRAEIFRFASGMALGDLLLGISWVAISLLLSNQAMNPESIASVVLGETEVGLNAQVIKILAFAAGIGVASSFALAWLAAWWMTMVLPDRDTEHFR